MTKLGELSQSQPEDTSHWGKCDQCHNWLDLKQRGTRYLCHECSEADTGWGE